MLTIAELRKLENPRGAYLELHNGELVQLTRPRLKHIRLQRRLQRALENVTKAFGEVVVELPFRAQPEHDLRVADVALVSWERWNSADEDLFGAPELVIEVESPSNNVTSHRITVDHTTEPRPKEADYRKPQENPEMNSARDLKQKAQLCFAAGCLEFWTVYPDLKIVEVAMPDGKSVQYKPGEVIQSRFTTLPVTDIFN